MSDNIKVVVKVRPLISRELEDKLPYQWKVTNNTLSQLDASGKETGNQFTFDKVYDVSTKTADVYKDVAKPIVEAAIAGFNGTIFAYGQTSSGKTYTMSGTEDSPGIIQLAVLNLFDQIKCIPDRDFLVRVSFIEIYNETMKDLLNSDHKIKVRDTPQGLIKLEATEKFTASPDEVLDIMKEGEANRQTGATNMNEESSRSHSIFQITIESREHTEGEEITGCVNVSQLNLVDLAGSERSGQTGATGIRFKEGTHINKSLSALALVIKQLSEAPHNKYVHVNYRDSKLTRILQNSLGGNAKTSIICAVTPAAVEETISTLQFANRAKAIKNKPEVNAVATDRTKLQDLTKQLSKLQSELATKCNIEQDNRLLLRQIENLQKMILNGFGSCSIERSGARRKTWCAPRRMTISTAELRPVAEEDAPVPRFCTPTLKYNPMAFPTPSFQPIRRASQLAPVSEERIMITPPPNENKVNLEDEIIDLDSDEDTSSNTSRCSPYHKCQTLSKTPPCVLRKKLQIAEKDLMDIEELTKREKLYKPEVVEYMEKLEQSTNRISDLEDKIKSLCVSNMEKESAIELLKEKITQTEQEVQTCSSAKEELEAQCKDYSTKLTDLEVIYETLKTKFKLREDELLSLINDQTGTKKPKECISGKCLSRTLENFMDMSKDISLVSDNDSSVDSSSNEPPGQSQRQVDEMLTEISAKNEAIVSLESDILQQKRTIESLERTCIELREQISNTNSSFRYIEEENVLLKSSIDTLNSTINRQKQMIESANNDIQSLNIVIKELQANLIDKNGSVDLNISDVSLEKMIDNEEKLLANNENMRNIIHSFKTALESRDNQIKQLQAKHTSETYSSDTELLTKELEKKEKEIIRLVEEAYTSKEQIQENIDVIKKFIEENKELTKNSDDLSEKLTIARKQSCELVSRVEELEKDFSSDIDIFKKLIEAKEEEIIRLVKEADTLKAHEQESIHSIHKFTEENKGLLEKSHELSNKLIHAEKQCCHLETRVNELEKENKELSLHINELNENQERLLNASSDTDILKKRLEEKELKIIRLLEEAHNCKENMEENINVINKLMQDNKDLVKNTDALNDKLLNAENRSCVLEKRLLELEKENEVYTQQVQKYNKDQDQLLKKLNDFKNKLTLLEREKEVLHELEDEVRTKNNLIEELKSEISTKDSLISSISGEQLESQDYLSKWKSTVTKVQLLLMTQIGDLNIQKEAIVDACSFDELTDQLRTVENIVKDIIMEKELVTVSNTKLQEEVDELRSYVESLISDKNKLVSADEDQNQQLIQLHRELEEVRQELVKVNKENAELDEKLRLAEESYVILKQGINEKEKLIASIKNEEYNLRLQLEKIDVIPRNDIEFQGILQAKNNEIAELKRDLSKNENLLDEKFVELQKLSKRLEESSHNQGQLLSNIYKVAASLLEKTNSPSDGYVLENGTDNNVYSQIINILERVTIEIGLYKSTKEVNHSDEIKETIELLDVLKEQNQQLISKLSYAENENIYLSTELEQIKIHNENILDDLLKSDATLKQVQCELREKLSIIENLQSKIDDWKINFSNLEEAMKQQLLELQNTNSELTSQSQHSIKKSLSINTNETFSIGPNFSYSESNDRQSFRKSLNTLLVEPANFSPKSLLTLCCNKIVDAMQPCEIELNSGASNCNTYSENVGAETQTDGCDCEKLLTERAIALDQHLELKAKIEFLESVNINLLKEQEEIRKELHLLLEPAHELQKRISSHKTNLSTLTATTYAENKLLKSQVKVLQHQNNRMYNLCQRDLPGFKQSLQELNTILKNTGLVNRIETSIKRFSLPEVLDKNCSAFKDESTLDGDLLMLDTNVTLASVDNTLLVQDQTCLDGTQIYLDTEINTDIHGTIDPTILHTQIQMLSIENDKMTEKLSSLKAENLTLHEKLEKLLETTEPVSRKVDAQNSPMKLNRSFNEDPQDTAIINHTVNNLCGYCKAGNIPPSREKMIEDMNKLAQELVEAKLQKSELEKRCSDLNEEILVNDRLALKVSSLEKDHSQQLNLIDQLANKISARNQEFIKLQEENEVLSTQLMETIDESDTLRKEVEKLKESNTALSIKCGDLEELIKGTCVRCAQNISPADSLARAKSSLNRSRSDSESSSCCNKLSTLQNELLAGREDCKTISEDVATIKNHLERGELSMSHEMDLDDSMSESNAFSFPKELNVASPKPNKFVSNIPEEISIDIYDLDKTDCFNYYIEKTGAENNFSHDIKIVDLMKMFYNNLVVKHSNEVENLVNKLKDFEESRNQLIEKISQINSKYSNIIDEIKEKDNRIEAIAKTLQIIKNNINATKEELSGNDADKNTVLVTMFKNNVLSILDNDFDLSTVTIFENLIDNVVNQHKNDLLDMMTRYSDLQEQMELLTSELNNVTDNLNQIKCQLSEKEKEYNLLKAQKERVHEISSAVTLDIVQREKDLAKILSGASKKLIEHNIITQNDVDINWPVDKKISMLVEMLIEQSKQADVALQVKHNLALEVTRSKTMLEESEQELQSLKSEVDQLRELCKNVTNELGIKTEQLDTLKSLHDQLDEVYQSKVEENDANTKIVENLMQEINLLKATVNEKDTLLQNLQLQNKEQNSNKSETIKKITELMESINSLQHENNNLKSVNDVITYETKENALQLAQADDTIKKNKTELEKLTSEILTLKESLKESVGVIEGLKIEAKSLLEQNVALKKQFEEATELCSQLKLNIKTHERSAEIQCKIISRLKQEKETNSSSDGVKEKELKEMSQQCEVLQNDLKQLTEDKNKCQQEAQELREAKESLERRVGELEGSLAQSARARGSLGGTGDARARRRSLLDSKRGFGEDKQETDHKKMEAYFSTQEKPEDIFMDVDEHSNRSTPARNSRKSDSFQSRNDTGEEPPRPSSAQERRRRRQSLHDLHRSTVVDSTERLNSDELKANGRDDDSEVASLKDRLKLCQQELEELRERYREVDEECEICAQYLRERDEQCIQLKFEKKDLLQQIEKLNMIRGQKDADAQRSVANASVNTDEDWANLHSVVVDRMSFDREVDKNKSLQRAVDELRFKNSELKVSLAKMHKSIERAAANKANLKELEATKLELETCKRELDELKERCRELDEECETCGEYLRERDDQLCRLRKERAALEAKLEGLLSKEAGGKVQSVRKKRQSMHDLQRDSAAAAAAASRDAATETAPDLQLESDNSQLINNSSSQNNEIIQLKMALDAVSRQKQALELQLRAPPLLPPVLVATGSAIVQNQHLTEVMKENQKLKRMNAKLIMICKKRGKPLGDSNQENDDPAEMG